MVGNGALAQECRPNVAAEVDAMVRIVGQTIRTGDRVKPVIVDLAGQDVAVRQPTHRTKICPIAPGVEVPLEHDLAMSSYDDVDDVAIQARLEVLGRKVATPDHRQAG